MKTRKPKITFEVVLNELLEGNWMLSLERREGGCYEESVCLSYGEPLADLQRDAARLVRTLGQNASTREVPFEDRREWLTKHAEKSLADYEAAYLAATTDERRDQCAQMVDYHFKELTDLRRWSRTPISIAA